MRIYNAPPEIYIGSIIIILFAFCFAIHIMKKHKIHKENKSIIIVIGIVSLGLLNLATMKSVDSYLPQYDYLLPIFEITNLLFCALFFSLIPYTIMKGIEQKKDELGVDKVAELLNRLFFTVKLIFALLIMLSMAIILVLFLSINKFGWSIITALLSIISIIAIISEVYCMRKFLKEKIIKYQLIANLIVVVWGVMGCVILWLAKNNTY